MKRWYRIGIEVILVAAILITGVFITERIIATRPRITKAPAVKTTVSVNVKRIRLSDVPVVIEAEGTVRASRQIQLVPMVSGKVVFVSENLKPGRIVHKDELLIKLEDTDYKIAIRKAEAEVARRQSELKQLMETAESSVQEWRSFNPDIPVPPLVSKQPQLKAAEAALEAARAALEQAIVNLKRTELRAPFDAVVLKESVDIGQYVRVAQSVATLASVDAAEVKVFLNRTDAAYLLIPGFNVSAASEGSRAEVFTDYDRDGSGWTGKVLRAEPVDEQTRTLPVVIEVKGPYRRLPPLSIGQFVRVKITGRILNRAAILPEEALQWDMQGRPYVWTVDQQNRLRMRLVRVEKVLKDRVIVSAGIDDDTAVVLNPPLIATEGMQVRVQSIK